MSDIVKKYDIDFEKLTDDEMSKMREEILEQDESAIVETLAYIIDYKYTLTDDENPDNKVHKFLKDDRFWSYYEKILENIEEEDDNGTS